MHQTTPREVSYEQLTETDVSFPLRKRLLHQIVLPRSARNTDTSLTRINYGCDIINTAWYLIPKYRRARVRTIRVRIAKCVTATLSDTCERQLVDSADINDNTEQYLVAQEREVSIVRLRHRYFFVRGTW